MRKTVLSTDEIKSEQLKAIAVEPKSVRVNLSDIEVCKSTFDQNIMSIKGKTVSVSTNFLNKFLDHVGIGTKMSNSFSDRPELVSEIINILNSQKKQMGNKELKIIVSSKNEIIDLTNTDGGRISNGNIFKIAETICDKNDLGIIGTEIDETNGNLSIMLLNENQVKVCGIDTEFHKFGIRISNSLTKTNISDFAYRLVCSNGMSTMDKFSNASLQNISPTELNKLFQHIERMKNNGFIPTDFEKLVSKAMETTASMNEVESGVKSIISNLNIPTSISDDKESLNMFINDFLNSNFPQYQTRKAELLQKGFDVEKIDSTQKKYIRCEGKFGRVTIWDLVNKLTYFGSNSPESLFKNQSSLQIQGGQILNSKKGFDLNSDVIGLLKL